MTARRPSGPIPLVCIGIWNPATGFARVLRELTSRLAQPFAVHWVGIGYQGPVVTENGVTLHPVPAHGGDVFGESAVARLTEQLQAPVVLALYDLWMLHVYGRTLPRLPQPPAVVAYVPVDGEVVDAERLLGPLAYVDRFICFSRFGKAELDRSIKQLVRGGASFDRRPAAVIPHGVDVERFHPLSEGHAAARRRAFGDDSMRDAFIVLNANRPTERKRIDLTLEGFARFAEGKRDRVRLVLHHALMDVGERAALASQVDRLGLAELVRLHELDAYPLDDEGLNALYNAADVGLNTSMGEGWGLVAFEHAATGAAQMVSDNSVHRELWDGAAEIVETHDAGVPRFSPLRMRTVTADGVAAALERLYADKAYRTRLADAALANAQRPEYAWDAIGERWRDLLLEVAEERMAAWADAV